MTQCANLAEWSIHDEFLQTASTSQPSGPVSVALFRKTVSSSRPLETGEHESGPLELAKLPRSSGIFCNSW